MNIWLSFTSVDARLSDLLADSLEVFVQLVSDDGADRVLQGARSVTDVAIWHMHTHTRSKTNRFFITSPQVSPAEKSASV